MLPRLALPEDVDVLDRGEHMGERRREASRSLFAGAGRAFAEASPRSRVG